MRTLLKNTIDLGGVAAKKFVLIEIDGRLRAKQASSATDYRYWGVRSVRCANTSIRKI